MTRNLDDDEAAMHNLYIRSENGVEQSRPMTIINESGLYSAILKSRKPEAKKFKKMLDEMKESTSEFNTALQKQLPIVFQGACLNLVERKPCEIDHHEFNRWA